MKTDNYTKEQKYFRAQKKVEELKKYYVHLSVYIIVNIFISVKKIVRNVDNGETFQEAFFDFGTFATWFFWGIGLVFHTFKVFGFDFFLGKNWEERKIKEHMDNQTRYDGNR
ncbi:2TM domain-containing protein [Tenacibaculum halocynthiae]|uniref:2TM domain-containing protein n=1 Tax=Tenacibaculum halocynthiae TaxID=1254437 RepID=UPI003D6514BB